MKKIIDYGRVWTCANMDALAPINWEGYRVLLDDNTIQIVNDLSEAIDYPVATENEKKEFYQKLNYIFVGDEVEVIKGRKIPTGARKTVQGFFEYVVAGTYGHQKTKYVVFTDGTKTNIQNIKNTKDTSGDTPREFTCGRDLSGRI